jgi:hypothetical protein
MSLEIDIFLDTLGFDLSAIVYKLLSIIFWLQHQVFYLVLDLFLELVQILFASKLKNIRVFLFLALCFLKRKCDFKSQVCFVAFFLVGANKFKIYLIQLFTFLIQLNKLASLNSAGVQKKYSQRLFKLPN